MFIITININRWLLLFFLLLLLLLVNGLASPRVFEMLVFFSRTVQWIYTYFTILDICVYSTTRWLLILKSFMQMRGGFSFFIAVRIASASTAMAVFLFYFTYSANPHWGKKRERKTSTIRSHKWLQDYFHFCRLKTIECK